MPGSAARFLQRSVRSISLQKVNPRTSQAETHTFKVRIPAGVQEGQTIRVPGKGGEGSGGGSAGDLYLRVRLGAHPDFRPRGADLYHDLHLAPWEAVLGCTVEAPRLDGEVSVRIPPGTNNGQRLRVRGRGLPRGQSGEHQKLGLPAGRADLSHAALQSHPPPIRTRGEPLRFTCLKDFRESLRRGKRVRAAMTVWTGLPPPRGDW